LRTSENNLEISAKSGTGRMRPTGKAGVDRQVNEPFGEVGYARRYECDNCGHVQFNASITENVKVSDSVSASVEKKK
jgi:hypothetical protein